jgi:hypothetical protein
LFPLSSFFFNQCFLFFSSSLTQEILNNNNYLNPPSLLVQRCIQTHRITKDCTRFLKHRYFLQDSYRLWDWGGDIINPTRFLGEWLYWSVEMGIRDNRCDLEW